MTTMPENNREERFLKTYVNLPIGLRGDIVYVLPEKGPITWNAVYLEVSNNTELGKTILEKLDELKII
ncbi:MAG: hypothetical protein Q8N98_03040 [bacterium]|nr:hypothetical protein [bacterium]